MIAKSHRKSILYDREITFSCVRTKNQRKRHKEGKRETKRKGTSNYVDVYKNKYH